MLRWVRVFSLTLIIVVVLVFAWLVIVVFSRRFRAYLAPPPRPPPTPSDDVWAMHKLPPELEAELRDSPDSSAPPPDSPA